MHVGVIRGDLPGPIFLSALEPVSQYNPPTEPRGQEVYLSRPTTGKVEAALANATTGAGAIIGGSDISGSFPLTINGTNDTLRIRTAAAASFTVCTIAHAAYSTFALLLAAVNAALSAASTGVLAIQAAGTGSRVGLEGAHGVNSYVEIDTVGGGSTADTPLGLTAGARTMPAATAFITAALPVGGPLNISATQLNAVGASTNSNALALVPTSRGTQAAVGNAIAPQLTETAAVIDSFLTGQLAELLNANFNPDPRRLPALTSGAAVAVVQDDGVTAYAPTLPTVSSATLNSPSTGDITIAGTGLGNPERLETTVKVSGKVNKLLQQKVIVANGGSVSDTSIVLKAVLIPGATTVTTSVRVQVRQHVSAAPTAVS